MNSTMKDQEIIVVLGIKGNRISVMISCLEI